MPLYISRHIALITKFGDLSFNSAVNDCVWYLSFLRLNDLDLILHYITLQTSYAKWLSTRGGYYGFNALVLVHGVE